MQAGFSLDEVEELEIEEYNEWLTAISAFRISEFDRMCNVAIHAQTPDKKVAKSRRDAQKEREHEKQRLLFGDEWNVKLWEQSHRAVKSMAKAGKIKRL